nr:amino acid ABC transporter permease [Desulfonispora thiosulfatigenes]
MTQAAPALFQGAILTVKITAFSVFFGCIIGLFLSFGQISKKKLFRIPAKIYVDTIRGTPLFVQILIFFYGIPDIYNTMMGEPLRWDRVLAAIIVCSINSGAYVSEIFRAGIQSIDKGQMEAARSLGMSHSKAMIYIILPQAFKRIVPPLGNEFIVLLKDTSLLAVIGVPELLQEGKLYVAATYVTFPIYIEVALIYLLMTLSISRWVSWMERRLGVSDRS